MSGHLAERVARGEAVAAAEADRGNPPAWPTMYRRLQVSALVGLLSHAMRHRREGGTGLSRTLLVYDAFHALLELAAAPWAKGRCGELGGPSGSRRARACPEAQRPFQGEEGGPTRRSPGHHAHAPGIRCHAGDCWDRMPAAFQLDRAAQAKAIRRSCGDVVGTGSSRKFSDHSVAGHTVLPTFPMCPTSVGGVILGGRSPVFFNTARDSGACRVGNAMFGVNVGRCDRSAPSRPIERAKAGTR